MAPDDSSTGSLPQAGDSAIGEASARHNLLFLSKFFRHGTKIASIWPSSRFMAAASVRQVAWSTAKAVVELGAGTGPITLEIIRRLQPQTTFVAIERDRDFVRILRDRFSEVPNAHIVHGDVCDLKNILEDRGIGARGVDTFVSGLGTPSLPEAVRHKMFAAVKHHLKPDGFFSNITEVPYYYLRYYQSIFEHVAFQWVPINLPPGGVYHCHGIKCGTHTA